ncbi:MAG: tRNA 5-methoxyuridine(34)/uridine 5-oxyacetic acid(34) synthase CmoB [Gammaproteobacteria bacterium]|nr:tRNA 5-methoxyuridine(34)/uridine 5-oxyacetic acid(34) synthase CmoB [Gammaproteobacteria bacterium]
MIDYSPLFTWLSQQQHAPWAEQIQGLLGQRTDPRVHGDFAKWQAALNALPVMVPISVDLTSAAVRVGSADQISGAQREQLAAQLRLFHPWRKGPFELFGVRIDTEWRSDWKWDRLKHHITPLSDRVVLDVGCGSGYHAWRMAGAGAKRVVGIEPMVLSMLQYQVLQNYINDSRVHVLPLATSDMPTRLSLFDTVFSMGLLYHQRQPSDHLNELAGWLRPGGELVLETLVIDVAGDEVLVPKDRYARMPNVWAIPSVARLTRWLSEAGYQHIRCVDVSITTLAEQRRTAWMQYHSLADFLDPNDNTRTIEGYPAPTRAIMIANTPA